MGTANFNWSFPALGATSWSQSLIDLVRSIEVTVNSVFNLQGRRAFTIVSAYPTNSFMLGFDSSGQFGGSSNWVVMSSAPYGRYTGSFTVRSGYPMLLSVDQRYGFTRSPVSSLASQVYFRGIVNPGSIEAWGSNSVWRGYFALLDALSTYFPAQRGFTVMSLAAGTYSVTFHVKAIGPGSVSLCPGLPFLATVKDVRP